MFISQVRIKGFRNFQDATINFNQKSLIIGPNEVGKTNLIHALRILLDRTLSDSDIEPLDSDFYAGVDTHNISVLLKFEQVTEEPILSKMKGYVSDNGIMYLEYRATRDSETHSKNYSFLAGHDPDMMEEITERYYRRVLHLKYISSKRDMKSFIKKEKKNLFINAKDERNDEIRDHDLNTRSEIEENLNLVNSKIRKLSFIKNSTTQLNEVLNDLSFHHSDKKVIFDVVGQDVDSFIENVELTSNYNGKNLVISGDGRNNQIVLALWSTQNKIATKNNFETIVYCIEEPESHLHPHQQRKLADYLSKEIDGQTIITTHSPQITSGFSPNSIIRLKQNNYTTTAASNGCSKIIEDAWQSFGYRMSIIPAEAFFSDFVFLVEGPSEVQFYHALAKVNNIDLDRYNISILMVGGIGFEVFIQILNAMEIAWIIKTDNDIFKVPNKKSEEEYRFAGIERIIKYYSSYCIDGKNNGEFVLQDPMTIPHFNEKYNPPTELLSKVREIKIKAEKKGIFLSDEDLEKDILNSDIKDNVLTSLDCCSCEEALKLMQEAKADFMFKFLLDNQDCLKKLRNSSFMKPIKYIIEMICNGNNTDESTRKSN